MGKGYIVRRGGGGEQATKPIFNSVVSAGFTSITINIENDDNSEAILYYSVVNTDPGPDQANTFSVTLDGRTAGNATITGLTASTSYTLYIKGFAVGKFPSDIVTVINQLQTASPIVATGGTITNYTLAGVDYRAHTFTGNGTFAVSNASVAPFNQVDYLIIAGGGTGGDNWGSGGGGAGGYRTTNGTSGRNSAAEPKISVTAQNYTITVGAGGPVAQSVGATGAVGADSSALGITSTGGGRGAGSAINSIAGGSGGGGHSSGVRLRSLGTANQGFDGGAGLENSSGGCPYQVVHGGGGGGAGENGLNATTGGPGRGGNGLANLLRTGSNETRGGGGGGGRHGAGGVLAAGGAGGGGEGGNFSSTTPTRGGKPGAANTGGGGGGAGGVSCQIGAEAGAGGSGIVIIRYVVGGTV